MSVWPVRRHQTRWRRVVKYHKRTTLHGTHPADDLFLQTHTHTQTHTQWSSISKHTSCSAETGHNATVTTWTRTRLVFILRPCSTTPHNTHTIHDPVYVHFQSIFRIFGRPLKLTDMFVFIQCCVFDILRLRSQLSMIIKQQTEHNKNKHTHIRKYTIYVSIQWATPERWHT